MGFTTTGFLLSILFIVAFIIQWNSRISKIERLANQSVFSQEIQFPIWAKAGQVLENDWISERILKSNLVYTLSEEKFSEWRFIPDRVNWEERRKHDPLVFLASIISTCTLTDLERVKILRCLSDSRHKSQERLWAGDNLSTSYIVTDVDIYSDLRISYTEKYLNIKNGDKRSSWWGNMEEAIYTFQLPEGSVVTSLSLWVNGKEEKAILSSKQKAAEAYKAIVGRERRDPSIVQWQEGNTVSVRVFPCTSEEERKFKIGITSPLSVVNGKLVYKDISFKGPNAINAKESRRISIIGSKDGISFPKEFTKDKRGNYISEGDYDENFQFSFDLKPIQPNAFHFKRNAYSIEQYVPKYHKVALENIYLDVNKSWSKEELDGVKPLMAKYKLYVSLEDGFVALDEDNWSEIMDELATYNFSLFPFHDISDPQHSIVITKGKEFSPQLKDIKGSEFAEKIGSCFGKGKEIRVFNFGPTASTYIRSLREFRALEYATGDLNDLNNLLRKGIFPASNESDEYLVLHDSKLALTKKSISNSPQKVNAPDHLARLFAYNDIMRKVGSKYFDDGFINKELVEEASMAYVVSPVSSLIVLETQNDYDRFDIKKTVDSLENASKNSSGAVPEPHEWVLIILFATMVIYLVFKPKFHFSI